MAVSRCRSCHVEIFFGLTTKGKRMPIDLTPVEDGNMVVEDLGQVMGRIAGANENGPGPAMAYVRVLRKGEVVAPDVARYQSHFSSCPAAETFRSTGPRSYPRF